MRTKNHFEIRGFVGDNPEIKVLEKSTVANLRIATNEKYTNKSGESVTNTDWHSITAWENTAKFCEKYVKKGMLISVEGRIKPRTYENKEGQKVYTVDFIAETVDILANPKETNETEQDV